MVNDHGKAKTRFDINAHIVRRICAIYQYNCTKNGKGLKIVTKEADTI